MDLAELFGPPKPKPQKTKSTTKKKWLTTLLFITVLLVVSLTSYQIGSIWNGSLDDAPRYYAPPISNYDYTIGSNGTDYIVKNGTTGKIDYSGTSASTILQTVLDISINCLTIYIKPPFLMTSDSVTLSRGNITLHSDVFPCDVDYGVGVIINNLTVDSSSADIRNIKFEGISFKHLHFLADGHYIRNVEVKNCVLQADTGSTSALVFEGDGTGNGWMDSIQFVFCVFITDSEASASVVTFDDTVFLTEVHFERCKIEVYASGITVFDTLPNAQVDSCFITNCRFYGESGTLTIFEFGDPTVERAGGCFYLTGGRIEHGRTLRIYYNPTDSTSYVAKITLVIVGLATESYSSCTIATGAQRSFTTGITQEFIIKNCKFDRSTTTLGTCPQINYVTTIIKDNTGVNPIGLVSNPFTDYATTAHMQLCPWGTASAPTASRNYMVQGSDVLLTSTGGTGVSITVKDANGNTYISGASTLTRELIPVGYTVTFGGFSVAPTVTAYFD